MEQSGPVQKEGTEVRNDLFRVLLTRILHFLFHFTSPFLSFVYFVLLTLLYFRSTSTVLLASLTFDDYIDLGIFTRDSTNNVRPRASMVPSLITPCSFSVCQSRVRSRGVPCRSICPSGVPSAQDSNFYAPDGVPSPDRATETFLTSSLPVHESGSTVGRPELPPTPPVPTTVSLFPRVPTPSGPEFRIETGVHRTTEVG